jgi:DNA mismatch repair protein MutS
LFATHYHELIQLEGQLKGVRNYSVTVRETSEGIVFLRKVVPGGSDRSYGIHVARLAGLPGSVTERAEQILRVLESENTKATEIIQDRIDLALEWAGGIRADAEDFKALNPILEEIRSLSVDRMTPLEALNRLAEWARRLHASESG